MEEWRVLARVSNSNVERYEVSNLGRVRSVGSYPSGKILRQQTSHGYKRVRLYLDSGKHWKFVHVLVARSFIGPCPSGKEVNHKDGVKARCEVGNLEYLTKSENEKHAFKLGLKRPLVGEAHEGSVLTRRHVRRIRNLLAGQRHSQSAIARKFKVSQSAIYAIAHGLSWRWLDGHS
jgi:hypothetical protein